MKNTYILNLIKSSIPFISLMLLLSYIFFNINPKLGGLGFILYSISDLYDNYINLKNKGDFSKISIIINFIMFFLGIQMILFPYIF